MSRTHHGASAFLLASGSSRILLTSERRASYVSKGVPSLMLEDAPMNRFEIGIDKEGAHYMCSALSPEGRVPLLPAGYKIIDAMPLDDGSLRFIWMSPPTSDRTEGALFTGTTSLEEIAVESDEPLLLRRANNFSEYRSINDQGTLLVEARSQSTNSAWVSDDGYGYLPQSFHENMVSIEEPILVSRGKVLSYTPLKSSARPLRAWSYNGRMRTVFLDEGRIVYMEEPQERAGEGLSRVLASEVKDFACEISPAGDLYIAWSSTSEPSGLERSAYFHPHPYSLPRGSANNGCFTFARLPAENIYEGDMESITIERNGDSLDIVFDDHDRAFAVWTERGADSTQWESLSWSTGQQDTLLEAEGHYDCSLSRDQERITRGMCFYNSASAYLLLPVSSAIPLVREGDRHV